jgi:hypothetical protein
MAGSGESEAVIEDLSPVRPVNGRVVLLEQVRYFLPVLFVKVYPEMLKNGKIQLLIKTTCLLITKTMCAAEWDTRQ